jgi:hypothetical protein
MPFPFYPFIPYNTIFPIPVPIPYSLKRLHDNIRLHALNKPLISGAMTPRLQALFLAHGIREAVRPLLAREGSYNVLDCGFGNQVRVGAQVVCSLGKI